MIVAQVLVCHDINLPVAQVLYLPRYIFSRSIFCGTSASLPRYTFIRGKKFAYDCDCPGTYFFHGKIKTCHKF